MAACTLLTLQVMGSSADSSVACLYGRWWPPLGRCSGRAVWLRPGATYAPYCIPSCVLTMQHSMLSVRGVAFFSAERRRACLQDACCEVPSDWLDQGQSDINVPTVPDGFMREVVIHEQAYTQSSATRSRIKHPAVFYHYFQTSHAPEGPAVQRKALLRAAANPDDPDAMDTVKGFLRSHLCNQMDGLQQSDFDFSGADIGGSRSVLTASLARTPTHTTPPATLQHPSREVVASTSAVGATSGSAERSHGGNSAAPASRSSHPKKKPSAVQVGFLIVERVTCDG